MNGKTLVFAGLAATLLVAPTAALPKTLVPDRMLTIEPPIADTDERENLSGAACMEDAASKLVCMLVGDEKRYARYFTLSGDKLVPGDPLFLLPAVTDGAETTEADGEGIAYADGAFFITGSHSASRKGKVQPSRHKLYRIAVGKTGRPPDLGTDAVPAKELRIRTLDPMLAADSILASEIGKTPGEDKSHGVNIEGIAVKGAEMFVGLRGPLADGRATILIASAAFPLSDPQTFRSCRLPLGDLGVRDLAAVNGGLLILAGPEMRSNGKEAPPPGRIYFWDGATQPVELGILPLSPDFADGPEALAVLSSSPAQFEALVMSDGPTGGEPAIYKLDRPLPSTNDTNAADCSTFTTK